MPTFEQERQAPVDIAEAQARAAWRILCHEDLEMASIALLDELLQEEKQSTCAFLVIGDREGEGDLRLWGRTDAGETLEDPRLLLNHQASRRALAGAECFTVEGFEGAPHGPELFLSRRVNAVKVVASLRRSLGAAPFTAEEVESLREIFLVVTLALERQLLRSESSQRLPPLPPHPAWTYHGLTCRSPAMRSLVETIERVKDTDFSVCIVGESGTGKELVARAIHNAGTASDRPFVAESASAVTENLVESELFGHVKGAFTGADEDKDGLFVLADGGTLYLDEIGDMSQLMQRKLLRVIQEGEIRPVGAPASVKVDVRLITSTNRDLERMVEEKEFRGDLYWRLNVITIEVPPLRKRLEDLPILIREIQEELRAEGIRMRPLSKSALRAMENYHWPGNVRQLVNVLRRVTVTCRGREIGKKDLLGHLRREHGTPWRGEGLLREGTGVTLRVPLRATFKDLVGECEKAILLNALEEYAWNKSEVTRALKIPRQSLYNKMEKYGIQMPSSEEDGEP